MIPTYLKPYHTNLSNLIRLGRKSDGGYVIDKRVINKTNAIITCGLEAEWSFEKQFQKYNKNCKILAFDHTVNKKFWAGRFLKDFIALLLLKIDIEGDEYKVLKDVNKNFKKLNLVIIEFHNIKKNLKKIRNFINQTKLRNIHINANNYGQVDINGMPQVIEMTLINPKKFKIKNYKTKRNYPIKGLDFKNHKRGPSIRIIFNK